MDKHNEEFKLFLEYNKTELQHLSKEEQEDKFKKLYRGNFAEPHEHFFQIMQENQLEHDLIPHGLGMYVEDLAQLAWKNSVEAGLFYCLMLKDGQYAIFCTVEPEDSEQI